MSCSVCLLPDCDREHIECSPPPSARSQPRTIATRNAPAKGGASRSPRHTSSTVALARSMYGAGDAWTPTQIARYLADHGKLVSVATIREWVIPGLAEKRRRAQNARTRQRAAGQPTPPEPTPLLDRIRQLREQEIGYRAIGIVLGVYEGAPLTAHQVRHALTAGREPKRSRGHAR